MASIFVAGGRRMLAPIIIKRKLSVGCLCKSEQKTDSFWYIPVRVDANIIWNLLVSNLGEVKATIDFIEQNTKVSRHYQATWIDPNIDDALITLRIGSKREVRVATETGTDVLKPIDETQNDSLFGNQDIILTLTSSSNILGRWLFKRAMVEGVMQKISPVKLKDKESSELTR